MNQIKSFALLLALPAFLVGGGPATTALISSVNPSSYGQSVTLTASVSPSSATGKVSFFDGETILGSGVLVNGLATLTTKLLGAGPRSLRAYYLGDGSFSAASSTVLSQTVNGVAGAGFETMVTYDAGLIPYYEAVADFNGDGYADLVVSNENHTEVNVLLGNGDGTFQTAVSYSVSNNVLGVATADLDGDGYADIVVTSLDGVGVLLGDGTGAFASAVNYGTGTNPQAVTVGDFNGDGIADLAVFNSTGSVSVLLGNGDGTFQTKVDYATGGAAESIVAADFNEDGYADLVVPSLFTNKINVLLGNGDGTFNSAVGYATGVFPGYLTVADLNGDGHADVVVSNLNGNTVSVLLGKGDGTFEAGVTYATGLRPEFLAVADFDGDGKLDIAVSNDHGTSISVLAGNGDGTFQAKTDYAAGNYPGGLVAADFNGDGIADLAVANNSDADVGVLLGKSPQAATTTTLTSSANPSSYGISVTLTATVASSSATGTVTFKDGSATLGTGTLSSGTATYSTAALTGGSHSLTAVYGGDANYATSSSTAVSQVVDLAGTATSITSSANPSTYGQNATFTITVVPSTVTGTYAIKQGSVTLGSGTLTNGTDSFSLSTLPAGVYTATVVYSGDGNYATSTSSSFTQTVNQSPTTTALTSSLSPSSYGQPVTLTAAVSPAWSTGTVTFMDGATVLGTGTVTSGVATFSGSRIAVGSRALTAVYGGDSNDLGSTSTALSQTVNQATPTTTLISSLNPSTYGQSVTLTATLSNGWATGTVTFKEGSTVLGTGTVSSPPVAPNSRGVNSPIMKTASVSLSSLSVGIHLLTAVYGGDVNDVGSSSAALSQLVNQAPSTTTVTTGLNPSYYGQTVTVMVSVSPVAATGMVTFRDGPTVLGTRALSGGSATLDIATLSVGVHSLTASYVGDGNDTSSVSAAWIESVNPAQTTMNFSSTSNPSIYGDVFTLVASVSRGGAPGSPAGPAPSPLPPTGSVTFLDGQTVLGVGNISGGSASFTVQVMASGTHALSAMYSGDVNDLGSSGWLSQQVDYCTAITTATSLFTDSTGGPQTVTVSTANPSACVWSASTGAGWISLSANGGKGAGGLTATIAGNLTGAVRTGTIVLGSQSIAVTQRATAQVFADVSPSAYYFDAVNLMFSKGISSGCGTNPLIYCPGEAIPRWQMAVLIVRAVFGGDKFTSSPSPYFSDVAPGDPGFRWIQKMYELGISSGCGGGNFCPAQTVTRDQMAIFATRMRYGAGAAFDFPITPYFTDVTPDTFGWSWIQRLRLDNVTGGCAATLYCPGSTVTRGDMALIVIAGGFNGLLPAGTPVISSISPSSVYQGESSSFTITGVNTNFTQGLTVLGQIPGIVIGAITVNSATSMTVEFTAAIDAVLQPVSVVAITGIPPGNEEAVLPNGVAIYGAP